MANIIRNKWVPVSIFCENPDCDAEFVVSICVSDLPGGRSETEVEDIPHMCEVCLNPVGEWRAVQQAIENYEMWGPDDEVRPF